MTADLSSHADLITQLRSRVEAMAASAVQERDGLRAERDQVVQERDGLRAERDQVVQERDGLRAERDQVLQERDGLRAERDQVVQERDGLKAERDRVMKAFLHVFPYGFYAEVRPDLSDRTNEERAIHFVCHGINEGVSLEYSRLCASLAASHDDECKPLVARLNELEALVSQYSARLSVVQDLFVRLSMEKRGS
ncbi:hypothetical protein [Synechococcus sp. BA-132 BA5]|uniref:hypothetical protein n=1 Tax=Synechococcus sp. BA-132 BA5 TaxID=3110252 RepID=UPI002B21E1EB|nr:hypothetical protein [Synechococcus sp. BA-132 BA5]MEA5415558.1 hypothetical protein [Synechococcus sp. BA-132 BA5]